MELVTTRRPGAGADSPCAVALGYFDGVHLGHQAVINAAAQHAQAAGLRLAVFTFTRPVPGSPKAITILTERQKHALLAAMDVDTCYEPPFESFSGLSPEAFFKQMLLAEYGARALFSGEDFGFGAQRAGNVALLRQLCDEAGLTYASAPTVQYLGSPVSSSRIKEALAQGHMEDVAAMLGRPYETDYPVHHGRHLGTTLGFPTANQQFPPGIATPAYGVYITQAVVDGTALPAVTGFGTRPTVDGGPPSCETFIPEFSGSLYGKPLQVRFYKKIDDSHRFASLEELAAAVQAWAAQAMAYFDHT